MCLSVGGQFFKGPPRRGVPELLWGSCGPQVPLNSSMVQVCCFVVSIFLPVLKSHDYKTLAGVRKLPWISARLIGAILSLTASLSRESDR